MGLFGNLFEKKECAVCGGEIGLLGNRKLEDGNLCKECAKKLSPWFSERRHSTVEEIKQQLAYREENQKKAAQFSTSRSIGEEWKLLLDESHRWLTVTRSRNLAEANPDILDFQSITGCRMDIDENRTELLRDGPNDKKISYNPPRYEYAYNFDVIITVSNPYFDEMRFRLNPSTIRVEQGGPSGMGRPGSGLGQLLNAMSSLSGGFDPTIDPEYRQYYQMAQEICEEVRRVQAVASGTQYVPQGGQQYAPQGNPQYGQPYAPQGNPQYGQPYAPQGNPQYGQQQYAPQGNPQYGQPYAPQGNPQYGQPYAPQGNPQYGQQYAPQAAPQYAAAPVDGPWVCPACNGQNGGGRFCEFCGTSRP